ncbi:hypothetical protein BD779DRAFT_1422633, partial [Infundibulicybe gibba]
ELGEGDIAAISEVARDTQKAVLAAPATGAWVMGDFWPGNIMLAPTSTDTYTIYVIDWELAKPGLPAHDIGQFCAELDLLDRFAPSSLTVPSSSPAKSMLHAFIRTYAPTPAPLARTALVHWGCHLAVWTPRAGWGAREPVRAVVKDGVAMMLCGARGD